MSYLTAINKDKKAEKLVCPNAPKITIKPEKKKIPYINVIENDDSFSSEEQKEKPISKAIAQKIERDDKYEDDDSFDSCDKETKSESRTNKKGKEQLKKFQEDNVESFS